MLAEDQPQALFLGQHHVLEPEAGKIGLLAPAHVGHALKPGGKVFFATEADDGVLRHVAQCNTARFHGNYISDG